MGARTDGIWRALRSDTERRLAWAQQERDGHYAHKLKLIDQRDRLRAKADGRAATIQRLQAELATAREERDVYKRAADDLLDVAHRAHGKAREIAYGLNRPETTEGPDETEVRCPAREECSEDNCAHRDLHRYSALCRCDRWGKWVVCCIPETEEGPDEPYEAPTPPTPPTLTPFGEFAARVRAAGLTPHNVATNWHWQIRDGLWIINVYPNTINGFWMQRQNENGKPGTVEEAIAMANEVPF